LLWSLAIVAVAILILLIGRGLVRLGGGPTREAKSRPPLPELEVEPEEPSARRALETDVNRLLELAAAALAAVDRRAALEDLQAALLRELEGAGRVHLDPAKTHGDYLSELHGDPDLRTAARAILRLVEKAQFDREAPDAPAISAALGKMRGLLAQIAAPLLI